METRSFPTNCLSTKLKEKCNGLGLQSKYRRIKSTVDSQLTKRFVEKAFNLPLTKGFMVPLKAAWGVADFISSICAAYNSLCCLRRGCHDQKLLPSPLCLSNTLLCVYAQVSGKAKTVRRRLCRALADGHTDPTEEGWASSKTHHPRYTQPGWAPLPDITNGVQDKHHSK